MAYPLPIWTTSPLDQFTIRDLFSIKAGLLGNTLISLTNIGLYLLLLILATLLVSFIKKKKGLKGSLYSILGNETLFKAFIYAHLVCFICLFCIISYIVGTQINSTNDFTIYLGSMTETETLNSESTTPVPNSLLSQANGSLPTMNETGPIDPAGSATNGSLPTTNDIRPINPDGSRFNGISSMRPGPTDSSGTRTNGTSLPLNHLLYTLQDGSQFNWPRDIPLAPLDEVRLNAPNANLNTFPSIRASHPDRASAMTVRTNYLEWITQRLRSDTSLTSIQRETRLLQVQQEIEMYQSMEQESLNEATRAAALANSNPRN